MAMAPDDCKPRNWKPYVDGVIYLVHTGNAEELQQHNGHGRSHGEHKIHTERVKKTTACHSLMQNLPGRKMAV